MAFDITVVMITMENDKTLRGILGVEEYHKLLREISEDFLEWSRPYGYDVEWYYLGTGMFRCVMNQRIKDQAEDFAERINEKLKKGYKYNVYKSIADNMYHQMSSGYRGC